MKKYLLCLVVLLTGCGHRSFDNELIGQVKKIKNQNPLICAGYQIADISLGIMRNGSGSISKEDIWLYIPPNIDIGVLRRAAESGEIVKVRYNEWRFAFCKPEDYLTSVEIVK